MGNLTQIDRQKVIEEFDQRARLHGNENAVLDADKSVNTAHQNFFRDYLTKQIVREHLQPQKHDIIVDYGCGVGRLARMLAPHVAKVEAFDTSVEMLRVAKSSGAHKSIHYELLQEKILPLADNSVTKFFTFWVLQHMDDEEVLSILKEAKRVLVDKGKVLLFEQVKMNPVVLGDIHYMRTADAYCKIAAEAGLTLVDNKRVFRFPSYAMSVWQRFSSKPKSLMPILALMEKLTVNRKPATIDYSTNVLAFIS